MAVAYDEYYQSENLFGTAYPELIDFFKNWENRGKLLDLGCGQGRDAIPLAKMGYQVTAIDHSSVGIGQLNDIAAKDNLPLEGLVADIFTYQGLEAYDFILLDSMFHFTKSDLQRETEFIKRVISKAKEAALIAFYIQDTSNKVKTLNSIIIGQAQTECIRDCKLVYTFEDKESKHKSVTDYRMLVLRKSPNQNHQ
jgi:SAM-dependent methyltransferase